jgi:hypothetical protein
MDEHWNRRQRWPARKASGIGNHLLHEIHRINKNEARIQLKDGDRDRR